jgi:hypothetical protein
MKKLYHIFAADFCLRPGMILATSRQATLEYNMVITESKHGLPFVVFFFVVALAINSVAFHRLGMERAVRQQTIQVAQQEQVEAVKKTEQAKVVQDAAAKHAQFVAQYVNSGFSKRAGIKSLAVLVVNQKGQSDSQVGSAIASHFKSENVKISSSFFKPQFVTDRLFAGVFDGSSDILNQLDLTNSLDALVLAEETVEFVTNSAALDNVITATMTVKVQVVQVSGDIENKSWKYIVSGAGFSQTEAESNAGERLIKKISDDKTMSLGN